MRFRDIFLISFVGLISYAFWSLGGTDITPNLSRAKKINREDARRQGTYLLNKKDWVEFQVSKNDISSVASLNTDVAKPFVSKIFMPIVQVNVNDSMLVNCLLDSASTSSFICAEIVSKLQLKP